MTTLEIALFSGLGFLVLCIGAMSLIALVWNWTLSRQVRKRFDEQERSQTDKDKLLRFALTKLGITFDELVKLYRDR